MDQDRTEALAVRLEAAWQAAGPHAESVNLEPLLPPRGDPRRVPVLRALIPVDLGIRCRRRRAVDLEHYLAQFPELGTAASVSPELIRDEYAVRRRHGQAPAVETYRARFPAQFTEFQRLIAEEEGFGTYLPPAPPTVRQPETPRPAPKPVPAAPRDGARVLEEAGYRLLSRLGKGAFGEVWRAEAPGRVAAAVKVIHRSLQQKQADREARAMEFIKELRHPFLLQTHAYWPLEDQLLIVMDLADGTLGERLKQCKEQGLAGIPAPELLRIFREAAEAVDFLHAHNVLHRDIKPANVLLVEGHAKVADFGLAKLQDTAASATTLGTPYYMAPEVWRGQPSARSDQYALALSYAEMRLGRLPFAEARDMVSAMSAHLWDKPDLSGLPPAEQRVLLRALDKNPEKRYPNCLAFVTALEEACAPAEGGAGPH
ncbi:MAG TPA: serine/threonine-protein kinase, partial [Gemmataceae bacterium]|nr:serine/threonine-protein kinase [Gemmataceae bacterium]